MIVPPVTSRSSCIPRAKEQNSYTSLWNFFPQNFRILRGSLITLSPKSSRPKEKWSTLTESTSWTSNSSAKQMEDSGILTSKELRLIIRLVNTIDFLSTAWCDTFLRKILRNAARNSRSLVANYWTVAFKRRISGAKWWNFSVLSMCCPCHRKVLTVYMRS